jgi:hypothetical protein
VGKRYSSERGTDPRYHLDFTRTWEVLSDRRLRPLARLQAELRHGVT